MNFRVPAPVTPPARQPLPTVVIVEESSPSSSECSCVDCCFRCDSGYEWYSLKGKGKPNLTKVSFNQLASRKKSYFGELS